MSMEDIMKALMQTSTGTQSTGSAGADMLSQAIGGALGSSQGGGGGGGLGGLLSGLLGGGTQQQSANLPRRCSARWNRSSVERRAQASLA